MSAESIVKNPPFPKYYGDEFLVIERGEGSYLFDPTGRKYLDFGAGIAVNALGYGREDLARIAYEQMKKLIHISNLWMNQPAMELGEKLLKLGNFEAVHLGNSGSEANEAALKFARLYALRKKGEGHHKILSFSGSFHGRTMGAVSVTSTEKYRAPFEPLIPGVVFGEFNNCESAESILDDSFCAVIAEPIQGEGGINRMTPEFSAVLNKLCRKHDIILIADEVQVGLARCGCALSSELVGLDPDIVTLAKPLAGGLPLSATLIKKKINDLIHLGDHGGTFGGGPVTTAVACFVVDTLLDPGFLKKVNDKGEYLKKKLEILQKEFPFIEEIRGIGLLQGVKLGEDKSALIPEFLSKARDKGLILLRAGKDIIRIAPPLVIENGEIDTGIEIMKSVLKEIV